MKTNMISPARILSVTALVLAAACRTTQAQTQTDEELALRFDLTSVTRGAVTTNREGVVSDLHFQHITSRGIIKELGKALGRGFSDRAQLVVLAPTNELTSWTFQIQDGTQAPADVSGFFSHTPGSPVSGSWANIKTGRSGSVGYSVDTYSLRDQPGYSALGIHFTVSGFTTLGLRGDRSQRVSSSTQFHLISSEVSGSSDQSGNSGIVTGSVTAEGFDTVDIVVSTTPNT